MQTKEQYNKALLEQTELLEMEIMEKREMLTILNKELNDTKDQIEYMQKCLLEEENMYRKQTLEIVKRENEKQRKCFSLLK